MSKFFGCLFGVLILMMIVGWILNVVKFFSCDFSSPYKCEVVRGLGAIVPPVGGVAGYLDLGK